MPSFLSSSYEPVYGQLVDWLTNLIQSEYEIDGKYAFKACQAWSLVSPCVVFSGPSKYIGRVACSIQYH